MNINVYNAGPNPLSASNSVANDKKGNLRAIKEITRTRKAMVVVAKKVRIDPYSWHCTCRKVMRQCR